MSYRSVLTDGFCSHSFTLEVPFPFDSAGPQFSSVAASPVHFKAVPKLKFPGEKLMRQCAFLAFVMCQIRFLSECDTF